MSDSLNILVKLCHRIFTTSVQVFLCEADQFFGDNKVTNSSFLEL